jgi:hypothetical protein
MFSPMTRISWCVLFWSQVMAEESREREISMGEDFHVDFQDWDTHI